MLKITGNSELETRYPETINRQCVCLKSRCSACGEGFGAGVTLKCPACGADRHRCHNKAMTNEDTCRIHANSRPYSLYNRLAANLSDTALEEFIERDGRDLSQEFALSRLALSGVLDGQNVTSKELLENIKSFFDIALKKKRIEEGDTLNVRWNDELVASLRKRWRQVINEIGKIIEKHLTKDILRDGVSVEHIKKEMFSDLRSITKLLGNHLTIPADKDIT